MQRVFCSRSCRGVQGPAVAVLHVTESESTVYM